MKPASVIGAFLVGISIFAYNASGIVVNMKQFQVLELQERALQPPSTFKGCTGGMMG